MEFGISSNLGFWWLRYYWYWKPPPDVRMELIKAFKPYLEKRYRVVADRADLYAYFLELGVRLLKARRQAGLHLLLHLLPHARRGSPATLPDREGRNRSSRRFRRQTDF